MANYAEDTLNTFGGDLFKKTGQLGTNRTNFNLGQKVEQDDFMTRLRKNIAGQEALPHMYQRIGDELGLPNLRNTVNTLTSNIANIPQTYGQATRGFDVNANQLGRIITQKAGEAAPALTAAQGALSSAEGVQSNMIAATQAEQQKQLKPFETEQSLMSERHAREATGYSQDMQAELNTYITKLNSGITLTEGEKQRANQLAMIEKQFEANKKLKEMDIEARKYEVDKQYNSDPLGLFS